MFLNMGVINTRDNKKFVKTYEQELVEDVQSIITVFSSKLYGSRSHKTKKIRQKVKELIIHH